MQKLDRPLDGHDVLLHARVDVVHQGRHGGALPAPRRPGHEHQPAGQVADVGEGLRQSEALEGRHIERNRPHDDHERRALAQKVDPEPPDPRGAPREVVVAKGVEGVAHRLARDQLRRDGLGLIGRQPLLGQRAQLPVDPGAKDVPRLDVEIRRASLDGGLDDVLHRAHASPRNPPCRPGPASRPVPPRPCRIPVTSRPRPCTHRAPAGGRAWRRPAPAEGRLPRP